MFVGHGLLALAVASSVAAALGRDRREALGLGLVAAAFATLPDVDVLYPLLATAANAGTFAETPQAFWDLSTEIHRGVTHSLVIGAWTALAATLWAGREYLVAASSRPRIGYAGPAAAVAVLAAMVWTVAAVGDLLAAATVGVMALAALGITVLAVRAGLGPRALGLAALFGLASHPFGDLLTGQPPPLLFPLEGSFFDARVALHGDPTIHLVGAFLVELAVVWLAVLVVAKQAGHRPREHVRPQALAGVAFALAALVMPPPELSAATGFVAGALAVGLVGVPVRRRPSRADCLPGVCTALAAVTLAVAAYGVAYAVLGA